MQLIQLDILLFDMLDGKSQITVLFVIFFDIDVKLLLLLILLFLNLNKQIKCEFITVIISFETKLYELGCLNLIKIDTLRIFKFNLTDSIVKYLINNGDNLSNF